MCEGSSEGFLEEEALLDLADCEDAPWHGCLVSPLEGRGRYFDGVHFVPHPLSEALKRGRSGRGWHLEMFWALWTSVL